ncbi:hypothetical protein [Salisaeta longa]|uniref:hypothetical protein n=1 Tax=Salisaeta longa TaxID=503170 RepID=UPI00040300A9|nr:hypothetical protein [Salisaeta longa]
MSVQRSIRKVALILLLPLVLWGCDVTGAPDIEEALTVVSEQAQYTLNPVAEVTLVVTNKSPQALFLPTCGPNLSYSVERRVRATWKTHSVVLCPAVLGWEDKRVAPGATFRFTVRISEEGRYRVHLSYETSPDAEPSKNVRSEVFVVKANA